MFDNIEIPENIDGFINKGINKGQRKKLAIRLKKASAFFACILLTVFVTGIRVSPVFASNVARIPGLNYIVELVSMDKGLSSAVENDYIQHIGKSVENENIKFTIRDIIADNSGIIVFYSIENNSGYPMPQITDIKLTDSRGSDLKMSISYNNSPFDGKVYEGKVEFYSNENQIEGIPDNLVLQVKMAEDHKQQEGDAAKKDDTLKQNTDISVKPKTINGCWQLSFTVDKARLQGNEKIYNINKTIEVEGQKIKFESIKIYPIKSILSISLDEANTKKLFAFEDLKLIDETGQEWGRVTNGFTGSNPGGDQQTLNFQSNYFTKPKKLYITGKYIRALDKNKCYFTVDTEKREILYSPCNLLSLTDIVISKEQLFLRTEMKRNADDSKNNFSITNEAHDSNGYLIKIISEGMDSRDNSSYFNYNLELNSDFKGPVTFKICDYPSRIRGDFKVEIPLNSK